MATVVRTEQPCHLDAKHAGITGQQLGKKEQRDDAAGIIIRAWGTDPRVNVRKKHHPAVRIGSFAGDDVAASVGDSLCSAFEQNLLAGILCQPVSLLFRHIDGWNVKVTVFKEGEWIHPAHHHEIP